MTVFASGQSEVNTFVYLYKSAQFSLEGAKSSEEGQFYNLLNASVMLSFVVEAYVNHLGVIKGFPEWGENSNRTSIWKKYVELRASVGLERAEVRVLYPLVKDVIEFRNTMAHGRTKKHKISEVSEDILWPHRTKILTGWQKFLVLENVEAVHQSVVALVVELHGAAGLGDKPFRKFETSSMRITFSDNS
ncbi:hypothetical protein KH389_10730 [Pseudomonas qingdaonensis]|jgi:hypothetical protein|uniref:Apea-like HEPN domain-containing protein n=1 Tax=Pseudomonas qingdaonensis TaxID=2056231 RepID=A0ABX8DXR7_9PSED|nr:hypothetical protein [Pseudomonas qingdaonensis]QVL21018.1 hypothetical protein KH389_10730 [Pseudomonas qingdaonensis]